MIYWKFLSDTDAIASFIRCFYDTLDIWPYFIDWGSES